VAKTKAHKKTIYNVENTPDDFDFELPSFSSPEKTQTWLDSLPREKAEVDERLTKRVNVAMNLHQLMMDGFDYLAELKGISNGKTLMYMVLNQYLNENLPDEF